MCSMTSIMVARSGTRRDPHVPAHLVLLTFPHPAARVLGLGSNSIAGKCALREGEETLSIGLLEHTRDVSSRNDVRE